MIRLIPCLDIDAGRVVKRTEGEELRDAGDPLELAAFYIDQGADDLMFLDITNTGEEEPSVVRLAERLRVDVPFIVGGGLRTLEHIREALGAGASKVCINTAAIQRPDLVREAASEFGERVIVAIDARRRTHHPPEPSPPADLPVGLVEGITRGETMLGLGGLVDIEEAPEIGEPAQVVAEDKDPPSWEAYLHGGRVPSGFNAVDWAVKVSELGAGEILVSSLDLDGFDLELVKAVADAVAAPVIANVGAGRPEQVLAAVSEGGAGAVLLTSLLHDGVYRIKDLRGRLESNTA